ncbi:MAG TPA: MbtH family NRPS accessory protein [Stackebrandtia sp.]|jgi:MbtH protein|uniref:MbtH family protein n=1 Tax=Stackebrandtia sp. TaxID=2023065 RepID=UPI002D6BC360|nr:MbtH family NRPS accessory protein [Stackebrandtia sp.]HZE39138.1 MbtH family NRPS accessory protein [Stackebrandtia sp.]
MFEDDDERRYTVVRNISGQYAIWPADRETPLGWSVAGLTAFKAECLAEITELWTDMRPVRSGADRDR